MPIGNHTNKFIDFDFAGLRFFVYPDPPACGSEEAGPASRAIVIKFFQR